MATSDDFNAAAFDWSKLDPFCDQLERYAGPRSDEIIETVSVLSKQPAAYQIGQEIKQRSHGLFSLSDGVLYSILYKLAKAGYVTEWTEESNRRIRVYYHLEPSGHEHYRNCLKEFYRAFSCLSEILPPEESMNEP